jgi:hypothetical protein
LFDHRDRPICARQDHVHVEAHEVTREFRKSFGLAVTMARLQDEAFTFDIAMFPKPFPERHKQICGGGGGARQKHPDLCNLECLLRLG